MPQYSQLYGYGRYDVQAASSSYVKAASSKPLRTEVGHGLNSCTVHNGCKKSFHPAELNCAVSVLGMAVYRFAIAKIMIPGIVFLGGQYADEIEV